MIKDIIITTQLFFRHSDSGNTFEFGQPCLLQPGWTQGFIAIFIFFFIIIGINFIILKSQPSEWGGWAWGSCDEDGCRQVASLFFVPHPLCFSSSLLSSSLLSSSLYFSLTSFLFLCISPHSKLPALHRSRTSWSQQGRLLLWPALSLIWGHQLGDSYHHHLGRW